MRVVRLILIVTYVASTVGLPEDLGLPGSGCRCAMKGQQPGKCCCSAKHGTRGSCCRTAAKPGKKAASCQNCLAAKGGSAASQYCSSNRAASGKNPKGARHEDDSPPKHCASEGGVTSCTCGSPVPGSFAVDDPRLVGTGFAIEGPPILLESLLLRDACVAGYPTAPETPPPKTA